MDCGNQFCNVYIFPIVLEMYCRNQFCNIYIFTIVLIIVLQRMMEKRVETSPYDRKPLNSD